MFWNEIIEVPYDNSLTRALTNPVTTLDSILFHDELLSELKTGHTHLINFIDTPENVNKLLNNIVNLTQQDCYVRAEVSSVHKALTSCEILTSGCNELLATLISQKDAVLKIISCLTDVHQNSSPSSPNDRIQPVTDSEQSESEHNKTSLNDNTHTNNKSDLKFIIPPQKATLICKLLNYIHSNASEDLASCLSKNVALFSKLIDTMLNSIELSPCLDILVIFLRRTSPAEIRYFFCELLCREMLVEKLIDIMTLCNAEDKQRNACQLLCDIIVFGRQEMSNDIGERGQDMLSEKLESKTIVTKLLTQLFSPVKDMKNDLNKVGSTQIVCAMNLLQSIIEQKRHNIMNGLNHETLMFIDSWFLHSNNKDSRTFNEELLNSRTLRFEASMLIKAILEAEDAITDSLVYFHNLLSSSSRLLPLGFMRLEIVHLLKALISTNSKKIVQRLVELGTIKVIIDLFFHYPRNNLLHTQVEQTLCLIINNYRRDCDKQFTEELKEERTPSEDLLCQLLNDCSLIPRLTEKQNPCQENYGHILQIIYYISINEDLDPITKQLAELKENNLDIYKRWEQLVSKDVASFNSVSAEYGALAMASQDNKVFHRMPSQTQSQPIPVGGSNGKFSCSSGQDRAHALHIFKQESVLPVINVDVLPKLRKQPQKGSY